MKKDKKLPKFQLNEEVSFNLDNKIIDGQIFIIDANGTFERPGEVSYDILATDENMLYKHIPEYLVTSKVQN